MAARMRAFNWSDAARRSRDLAPKPKDRCPYHAYVAVRDVDGVGAGAHISL